ncbi:MAG: STAS domain-containing protein [Fibrobacter sp.]|nr:STAS domain-containing protein [Fibrobacter sp. UWP2]MCR5378816.1 STAS domain-containing protein [Fibrobacter sp.]
MAKRTSSRSQRSLQKKFDNKKEVNMKIEKIQENDTLTVSLEGRLDTLTAPELGNEIQGKLDGVKNLVFDFAKLAYISSAGLRILLSAQKVMNKQGSMVIKNAGPEVKEIFDVTGFSDILTLA